MVITSRTEVSSWWTRHRRAARIVRQSGRLINNLPIEARTTRRAGRSTCSSLRSCSKEAGLWRPRWCAALHSCERRRTGGERRSRERRSLLVSRPTSSTCDRRTRRCGSSRTSALCLRSASPRSSCTGKTWTCRRLCIRHKTRPRHTVEGLRPQARGYVCASRCHAVTSIVITVLTSARSCPPGPAPRACRHRPQRPFSPSRASGARNTSVQESARTVSVIAYI
jgi:hypothetical protein